MASAEKPSPARFLPRFTHSSFHFDQCSCGYQTWFKPQKAWRSAAREKV